MTQRAFLFDIDGTLVDSTDAVVGAWQEVALRYGGDLDAILAVAHGRRDVDVVPEFFAPDVAPLVIQHIADRPPSLAVNVRAMPGAGDLLRSLPAGSWAAVTSGPRQLMTTRLIEAGLPAPEVLIGADDVERGKPDPQGYLMAARRLGVDPSACVVVEDAPAGIAAGRAAGALVVGIVSTHPRAELTGADIVIDELGALRDALAAHARSSR
jgi:mannitol-1-/sugar-/sorbitol-6-phosphatase